MKTEIATNEIKPEEPDNKNTTGRDKITPPNPKIIKMLEGVKILSH